MVNLTTLANVKQWLGFTGTTDDALLTRLITSYSQYIQTWLNRQFIVATQTETRNGTGTDRMMLRNYPVISVNSLTINTITIPPTPNNLQAGFMFDQHTLYLFGYRFDQWPQNTVINYTSGYQQIDSVLVPAATPFELAATMPTLSQSWNSDVGVAYASGTKMTKVASAPTIGQYTVSQVNGVWTYTFAAADAGAAINITYSYTPMEIEQACIELVSLRYREKSRIGENSKSMAGEVISFNVKDFPMSVQTILYNYKRVISTY